MVAEPGLDHSLSSDPYARREVPRHLLNLHGKAHEAGLDGKGIQAWLDWEMESMLWGVPVEISEADLEDLIATSEAPLERGDGAPGPQAVRPRHHRGAGSREGVQ